MTTCCAVLAVPVCVSILVLMEDSHRGPALQCSRSWSNRFNPCSDGRFSPGSCLAVFPELVETVSILVLMEDSHRDDPELMKINQAIVSILVLMEDSHRVGSVWYREFRYNVSILVLMEDSHRGFLNHDCVLCDPSFNPCSDGRFSPGYLLAHQPGYRESGFNPCSDGRFSPGAIRNVWLSRQAGVSILVLMEDSHRDFWVIYAIRIPFPSFNPCSDGRFSPGSAASRSASLDVLQFQSLF